MSATPGYPLYLDWLPAALERDARRDAAAVPHHRTHRRHRQQPRHHPLGQVSGLVCSRAATEGSRKFSTTRAFSWLKAPTRTFTFKTLLRHYAKPVQ